VLSETKSSTPVFPSLPFPLPFRFARITNS
jgi:hypothetical protein